MRRIILILLTFVIAISCGKLGLYNQDRGNIIASVGDKKLYDKDIQHLFNENTSAEDSILIAESYVENWVKNQVKLTAAEEALSSEEDAIEELVDNYRKSLMTYRYEDKIVNNSLDTTVTPAQIEEYYNANRDNLRLAGPVVKAAVVRLPKTLRMEDKFEKLFRNNKEESRAEFQAICQKNNFRYDDFSTEWTAFSKVISRLPFSNSNFDEFLRSKQFYETEDEEYKYMLTVISYRPTGDYSPLELQTNNIRKILLNVRRAELIRHLEDSLVRVARNNNLIQINEK